MQSIERVLQQYSILVFCLLPALDTFFHENISYEVEAKFYIPIIFSCNNLQSTAKPLYNV